MAAVAGFGTGEKVAFGAHNCTLKLLREILLGGGRVVGGELFQIVEVALRKCSHKPWNLGIFTSSN